MSASKIFRNLSRLGQLPPDLRRNKLLYSLKKLIKGRKESGDYLNSYEGFYIDLNDSRSFFDTGGIPDDLLSSARELTSRAMNREVCLLSDNFYKAGNERFDWNRDYVYDYNWDKAESNIGVLKEGTDVKNVWELGRLQFLLNYLIVLKHLKEMQGAEEEFSAIKNDFKSIVLDFVERGAKGIIRKSSMDLGISCVSIIQLINIAHSLDVTFTPEKASAITKYLLHCLARIKSEPEYSGGMRGNHYFSNICAQIFIHLSFTPRSRERHPNVDALLKEFERELHYQFGLDGGNFEASLSYNFFTLEMAINTINYIEDKLPDLKFLLRVEKKFQQIAAFALQFKDISEIPLVGDNDSGYFLRRLPPKLTWKSGKIYCDVNDRRYLFDMIENRFNDLKFEPGCVWNLNFDFGLHTYNAEKYFLTMRCGSVGQRGKGGHAHNDQLSITLHILNKAIIVDPGVFRYSYSGSERNLYRSTALHNVMQTNSLEQNPIPSSLPDDIFWLKDRARARIDKSDGDTIKGAHRGFGQECSREIFAGKDEIRVKDICKIKSVKDIRLHLHPDCTIKFVSSNSVLVERADASIQISFQNNIAIEDYEYCPEYGVKIPSKRLKASCEENEITWFISIK